MISMRFKHADFKNKDILDYYQMTLAPIVLATNKIYIIH